MPDDSQTQLQIIKQSLSKKQKALQNFLGTKEKSMRFLSSVTHVIQVNPKLLQCTPGSLIGAFMECAAIGLYPSNYSGDCYIIPYKDNAQFQIGYRGLKTLAYDSGVLRMGTEIVYSNDEYEEVLGTNPHIHHKPASSDRGEPCRAYAWAEIKKGDVVFKSMSKEEVMKIKNTSKAKNKPASPWNSNDPMFWMWQKTVFKQLAKMLPTSNELNRAIYLDNISEKGGYIKQEGKIIESEIIEQGSQEDFEVTINQIQSIRAEEELNDSKHRSIFNRSWSLDHLEKLQEAWIAKVKEFKDNQSQDGKTESTKPESVHENSEGDMGGETPPVREMQSSSERAEVAQPKSPKGKKN